jgi:chemotaxis protein CheC
MSDSIHVLVVRASDLRCAIPMDHVEQTFRLSDHRVHRVGAGEAVLFRDRSLPVFRLAAELGLVAEGEPTAGVVAWVGGRRLVLAVDQLIGQLEPAEVGLPALARSVWFRGACVLDDREIVPVLDLPAVVTGTSAAPEAAGLTELQASALREVGNIGAGHAATALSEMLGRPVDLTWAEALIVPQSRVGEHTGSPLAASVSVTVPLARSAGNVVVLLARDAADRLCRALGADFEDELGRSALREVVNILTGSYLAALGQLTGLILDPLPPQLEIDLLGTLLGNGVLGAGEATTADTPVVLIRSTLRVEGDDGCGFLFAPRIDDVDELLARLEMALAA